MRRISYVVVVLLVVLLSYLLLRGCDFQDKSESNDVEVIPELGEDVCRLIFEDAKKVILYPVRSKMDADEGKDTIFDLVICGKAVTLDKKDKAALLSLLSEEGMYLGEEYYPSAPFIPEYLIEFRSRKNVVHMVISLSGGYINVYQNHRYIRNLKYTQEYDMVRLLNKIMPDKSLEELLNLHKYE